MSDAGARPPTRSGMGRLASRRRVPAPASLRWTNAEGLEETREAEQLIKPHTVDVTDGDAVADAVARIEREQGPVKRVYSAAAIMPLGRILDQPRGHPSGQGHQLQRGGERGQGGLPPCSSGARGTSSTSPGGRWLPTPYMGATMRRSLLWSRSRKFSTTRTEIGACALPACACPGAHLLNQAWTRCGRSFRSN